MKIRKNKKHTKKGSYGGREWVPLRGCEATLEIFTLYSISFNTDNE